LISKETSMLKREVGSRIEETGSGEVVKREFGWVYQTGIAAMAEVVEGWRGRWQHVVREQRTLHTLSLRAAKHTSEETSYKSSIATDQRAVSRCLHQNLPARHVQFHPLRIATAEASFHQSKENN